MKRSARVRRASVDIEKLVISVVLSALIKVFTGRAVWSASCKHLAELGHVH